MGFLDKIIQAFGFEGEIKPEKQKKEPKQIESAYTGVGAKFALEEKSVHAPRQEVAEQRTENENNNTDVEVKIPKSQKEVQNIIEEIKEGRTLIVNLNGFTANDRTRALDFLSGAIYALHGKIRILDGSLYLISL